MSAQIPDATDSLVVEIGSGCANENIVKLEVEEEKSSDFDETSWGIFSGDIICYGPWDDENLFARVRNGEMKGDHSMGRYRRYINYLLRIIYSVGKPLGSLGYSRRLRQSSHGPGGGELSCPSLTDGSTVSESPFWIQAALKRLGRSNTPMPLDEKVKRRDLEESTCTRKQIEAIALHGLGARFWTLPSRLEHLELSDTDSSADTSSEDDLEEDDPFDILHQAIRKAFSPNTQLAEKIIDFLYQLPPDRRAQIYGNRYHTTSIDDGHGPDCLHNQECGGDGSKRRKRKRSIDASPSGSGSNQVHGGNDEENQVEVARRPSEALPEKRYACAYYKSDGGKYGPRAASRYKSCAGPGWKLLNHYKRHLERVHLLHQCSRCGEIFEKSDVLHNHLAQDPRCTRSEGIEPEGMSQQRWDELRKIFKRKTRGHDNPSDVEKWFLAWDFLFPDMDRPPSPYYEKPALHPVFTRIQGVFEASLSTLPQVAQNPDLRDEIMGRLTSAINAVTQVNTLELEAFNLDNDILPARPTILDSRTSQTNYIEANPRDLGTEFDWNGVAPFLGNGSHSNDLFSDYLLDIDAFEADVDANGDGT
ncbi:hypothetical protein F5B19DRAFT_211151 [Rostrohypoxylon terebratum]|nr:hypothetical protein F5B19DRAFT_211151 [Rostrohypoxylon terebratum]